MLCTNLLKYAVQEYIFVSAGLRCFAFFYCRCRAQRGEGDTLFPFLTGEVLLSASLRSWVSGEHRCSRYSSNRRISGSTSNSRSGDSSFFRVLLRSSNTQQSGSPETAAAQAAAIEGSKALEAASDYPCCFSSNVGVYVPQLGDIVRYFPQLHQRPPLQQDRVQLWTPHAFSPCDAAILSIRYEFPGERRLLPLSFRDQPKGIVFCSFLV